MPATPSTSRRKSGRHGQAVPSVPPHLWRARLLVPPAVFPKERVPAGFKGWEARVLGADRVRDGGLHLFVEFDGWEGTTYHFPASLVRTWVVYGDGEVEEEEKEDEWDEEEVEPPPRKSPRKTASTSQTPTGSRRRSVAATAAARTQLEGEQQPAEENDGGYEEQQSEEVAPAAMPSPAKSAAAQSGAGLRKRKAAGAQDAAAAADGTQQQQGLRDPDEDEEEEPGEEFEEDAVEPTFIDKAMEALTQTAMAPAAMAACYSLLRMLYPLDES